MQKELLLDIQRKVLGTILNAEEFSIRESHLEILSVDISEAIFSDPFHKVVARAINKLKEVDTPISDYTVLEFLQSHKIPRNTYEEVEYLNLISQLPMTPRTFNHYITMIIDYKLEN